MHPMNGGRFPHAAGPGGLEGHEERSRMQTPALALRKAAMVLVASCSIVGAVVLVWQVVTVEHVAMLSNGQLLGVLALFLLPGGTLAAWELDRRAAVHEASLATAAGSDSTAAPAPASLPAPAPILRHDERPSLPGRDEPRGRPDRHRHQAGPLVRSAPARA
jgi:hypothetical protein